MHPEEGDDDSAYGVQRKGLRVASSRLVGSNLTDKPNRALCSQEDCNKPTHPLHKKPKPTNIPEFLPLRQALEYDLLPCPTQEQFIQYEDYGTIGRGKTGGIIIYNKEGMFIINTEPDINKQIKEILKELAYTYCADTQKFHQEEQL
jgi:hypothetical protein